MMMEPSNRRSFSFLIDFPVHDPDKMIRKRCLVVYVMFCPAPLLRRLLRQPNGHESRSSFACVRSSKKRLSSQSSAKDNLASSNCIFQPKSLLQFSHFRLQQHQDPSLSYRRRVYSLKSTRSLVPSVEGLLLSLQPRNRRLELSFFKSLEYHG